MRQIFIAGMLLGLAFTGSATQIVYDPALHAQTAADHVVDFAKWAKTEVDAAETELNTLRTYENTVLQVARMGDPSALRSIPGISTVAELYTTGQRLMYDYQRYQSLLNPRGYQSDFNNILGAYQQPQWNGFQSLSGSMISPNQGLYQWDTARYNLSSTAQDQLKQLEEERQRLEKDRDKTLQSLQSATTQSDVQKYHAVLDGINGALSEVGARENQVLHQVKLKNDQIGAGQQIYRSSQLEQHAAAAYQGIDNDLSALPSENFRQGILWGQN